MVTEYGTAHSRRLRELSKRRRVRLGISIGGTIISACLQACALVFFVRPAHLVSSGFTGLALLLDGLTTGAGFHIPTYVGMVALNVPVALVAARHVSKRFVIFSSLQVLIASLVVQGIPVPIEPLLNDELLLVIFGGVLYGFSIAVALRVGASTAGTDFISLMIMNRTGRSAWGLIFAGNCVVIMLFGLRFGWVAACYSILFQFISTKTIESFYHRYDRVTVTIVTRYPSAVLLAYNATFRHGSSVVEACGGYSGQTYWTITSVVSSYEIPDIVALVKTQDPAAVMHMVRTEQFVGGFYRGDF